MQEDSLIWEIWGDDEYLSYLTEDDWEDLRKLVQTDFKPDLALEILNLHIDRIKDEVLELLDEE